MYIHKPIVFFDIETTGIDKEKDEITQIGAVTVSDKKDGDERICRAVVDEFEVKINPSKEGLEKLAAMPKDVCTFDADRWKKAGKTKQQALSLFAAYLKKYAWIKRISKAGNSSYKVALLAGHNVASFDKEFIFREARDCNIFLPADMRTLDTLPLFLEYAVASGLSMQSLTLESFVKAMKEDFEGQAHDALVDAKANALAYIRLCHNRYDMCQRNMFTERD